MRPSMLFMIPRLHWQIHAAIITAVRNKKILMQTSGDREVGKKGEKLRRESIQIPTPNKAVLKSGAVSETRKIEQGTSERGGRRCRSGPWESEGPNIKP